MTRRTSSARSTASTAWSTRSPPFADAVMELSAHGIVLTVEESGCLQAKVFLKRELFVEYDYAGEGRERFGLSLGLLVDCLNIFSAPGHASAVEIRYPGPDMQLLLKSVDSPDACLYAEIRTRIPDTIAWDYNFEHDGNIPVTFTAKIYHYGPVVFREIRMHKGLYTGC